MDQLTCPLSPMLFPRGHGLGRCLLRAAVFGWLCLVLAVGTAAAQTSEPTLRDVLVDYLESLNFPETTIALTLASFPPEVLDQPASLLGAAADPSANMAAFFALLAAGGGNVDTSGADCQLALGAAYSGLFTASIFEPWPLLIADPLAFSANLALKACRPVLRAPSNRGLEPDAPDACFATVPNQRTHERASKIFFAESGARDPDWGPLGTPITDHYNSGMATALAEVRRPGSPPSWVNVWDPFYADDAPENPPLSRDFQLAVGRNELRWRAGTLADTLDLVYVPLPGIPAGWKAPFAKKITTEGLRKLFEIGVDIGASLTREVVSEEFGEFLRDFPTDSFVTVDQVVEVFDRVPPEIESNPLAFTFEGTLLGGASLRTEPYRAALEGALTFSDNCDNTVELIPPPVALWPVDETTPVTWTVLDPGPNPASPRPDGRNAASVTQLVTVQDTLAPVIRPPEGILIESASPVVQAVQPPQIFDFVDAVPAVENDAPAQFPLGTTPVTWTVTDQSGNTASAIQYVTVKAPGTNTLPTAQPLAASAESFTTTPIIVRGEDLDLDSLRFRIAEPPENGFFVAPLFPYFVGDLRQQGLTGLPNAGCGRDPATIYQPDYVAIDDDERSFILNAPVDCIPGFQQSRITVLDRDGTFVVGRDLPRSQNLFGLWIDLEARIIAYTTFEFVGPLETYNVVSKLDLDTLETLVEIRLPLNQSSQKSVFDDAGFLYSTTSEFDGEVVVYDVRDREPVAGRIELDALDQVAVYLLTDQAPAVDLEIDSQRNLYVSSINQIWKFTPIQRVQADDGLEEVVPGSRVGWMGGCKGGAACDLARGASRGYGCSDSTCTRLIGGADPAGLPGQFAGLGGISLDPNDNLYVADFNNDRVQRFTPEGYFAGQARTSCSDNEVCFVRSEFSKPRAVSVNSRRFHVLDTILDVLYMFDTSVVEPLVEPGSQLVESARLLYQSNSGFTGTDRFQFVVGDGLVESAPAEVTVSVSRGFHPPEARDARFTFLRSEAMPIELVALDPDFPFDTLSYTIESAPLHGTLSGEGPSLLYVADPDFFGVDSFEFSVSDGLFSSEPARVTIEVLDSNLPATVVSPGAVIQAGLGYPLSLSVPFTDPGLVDAHVGYVDWGDGVIEDSDTGSITVVEGGNTGTISGEHRYASSGSFELFVCAVDVNYFSCAAPPPTVVVEPMADLRVGILDNNSPTPVGGELTYVIRIDHIAPDPGITPGIAAQGIAVELVLPASLEIAELPAGLGCQQAPRAADGTLSASCPLPPLSPAGFYEAPLVLRPIAALSEEPEEWTVEVRSTTPDPQAPNIALGFASVTGVAPPSSDSLLLGGVAEGDGWIAIVLEGQEIRLLSLAGETGAELAARLASEIEQDATLAGLGVTADAVGSRLTTNVPIEAFTSEDAGIFEGVLVGFEDATITLDLDYLGTFELGTFELGTFELGTFELGTFELGPASGTVLMSPTGRIAILPEALGLASGTLPQPPESDPFVELTFVDASNDAGLFEEMTDGTLAGRMPLVGLLEVELEGEADLFERSLETVGAGFDRGPHLSDGVDVQLASSLWTTGAIEVQGFTSSEGFLEPETFSGLDARDTPATGLLRLVTPLEIDVYRDGDLDERVPGFAELTLRLVPEPSAGLSAAIALLGLAWLRAVTLRRRASTLSCRARPTRARLPNS
jgi:hypothetical protein